MRKHCMSSHTVSMKIPVSSWMVWNIRSEAVCWHWCRIYRIDKKNSLILNKFF